MSPSDQAIAFALRANAPAERTHNYFPVYKTLALALQTALRHSLPLPPLDKSILCQSHLTWSAAKPAVGRHVDALGVDAFNQRMRNRAFHGIQKRLAARLRLLPPTRPSSLAPERAAHIALYCQRHPRVLYQLFENERRLILGFVRFCSRIQEWRQTAAASPARAERAIRSEWARVELLIRRLTKRRPCPELGLVLLREAEKILEAVD